MKLDPIKAFGPPADEEPSSLFLKLQSAELPSEVVTFPRVGKDGKPFEVRMLVLPSTALTQAKFSANKFVEKNGIGKDSVVTEAISSVIEDHCAMAILSAAIVEPNPIGNDARGKPIYKRVFITAKMLDDYLSRDEINVLFRMWQAVQWKYGPFEMAPMNESDVNSWIKVLTEGSHSFPLERLPSQDVQELATLLAQRNYILCQILNSLLPSLPESLAASLMNWGVGTGSYTRRVSVTSSSHGPVLLDDDEEKPNDPKELTVIPKPTEPIQLDDITAAGRK